MIFSHGQYTNVKFHFQSILTFGWSCLVVCFVSKSILGAIEPNRQFFNNLFNPLFEKELVINPHPYLNYMF